MIAVRFNSNLAKYVCSSWRYLEE
jgi:hypothetical protein